MVHYISDAGLALDVKEMGSFGPLKSIEYYFKGSIPILRVQLPCHFADEISWGSSLQASTVPRPCRCRAGGG